jgi:hypothetical protein
MGVTLQGRHGTGIHMPSGTHRARRYPKFCCDRRAGPMVRVTSLQRRVTNEPGSPILRPTENGSSGGQLPGFQPSTAVGEELLGGLDLAVERRRVVKWVLRSSMITLSRRGCPTTMANGSTIEVGMIGIEGVVGVAPLLGGKNRRPTCGYADCRLTARRTPCTLKATDRGQR